MPDNPPVDTLGTNQSHNPGWLERAELLARPENFAVNVSWLSGGLSYSEQTALAYRLRLVEQWATYMAAGMVKGVLKYTHDESIGQRPVADWMSNLLGEGADVANYQMLMYAAWRQEQEQRGDTP